MAKNSPVGYAFIYDLPPNIIRKYEVYMDSTCGTQPVIRSGTGGGEHVQSGGGNVDCGSFKAADELSPVDPEVQAIFNSLRSVWLVNPTLANTAVAIRSDPPTNPNTGQPFDLPRAAWDWPSGEGEDLVEYLRDNVLASRVLANQFVPGLGDMIYGVSIAVSDVQIGSPPNVLTVNVALDRAYSTIHLTICNPNGDCAKVDVKVVNGQVDSVVFNGVYGSDNMQYPSHNGLAPGQGTSWHWSLGTDADHFAQQLHRVSNVFIPTRPGCGSDFHPGLVIARVNGSVDSASWQCLPSP
jgi:hypothetical protein